MKTRLLLTTHFLNSHPLMIRFYPVYNNFLCPQDIRLDKAFMESNEDNS